MAIHLIPEDRYQQVQRELRAAIPDEPEPVNVRAVMELGARTFFVFRGRAFIAEPVPYRAGLRLQMLLQSLRTTAASAGPVDGDLSTDALATYERLVSDAVEVMRDLARPSRMPRWLFRLLRPDSFRNATEREIGELLGFFLSLRTRSSVSIQ